MYNAEEVISLLNVDPMTQLAELIIFFLKQGFCPEQMVLDCEGVSIRGVMQWYKRRMVKVTRHKTKEEFIKDFERDKSGAMERFWGEPFNYYRTLLLECSPSRVWELHKEYPELPFGRISVYM